MEGGGRIIAMKSGHFALIKMIKGRGPSKMGPIDIIIEIVKAQPSD